MEIPRRIGFVAALVCAAACGPAVDIAGGADESTGRPGESTAEGGPVVPATTIGSTDPEDSAEPTSTDADTGDPGVFIPHPDGGPGGIPCDIWQQDCPRGEKCTPWANDGSGAWNDTRCNPIAPDPAQPGEPCTVEGSATSGIDDCNARSMCWNVDPETNTGVCVAMCSGSEANPVCEETCSGCTISGSGVLVICLSECDPLTTETCDENEVCAPLFGEFRCLPQFGDGSGVGTSCRDNQSCDPGLFCADAAVVPGCEGPGCCTPYCNPAQDDGCEGLPPGTECVPWYDGEWLREGCASAPPGVCVVPS